MWHESPWEVTGCSRRPWEMTVWLIPPSLLCSRAFVWDRDRWLCPCPTQGLCGCEQPLSSPGWLLALENSSSGTAFCKGGLCSSPFLVLSRLLGYGVSVCQLSMRCHQEKLGLIWEPKKENWPNFDVSRNWYGALQSSLTVGFDLKKKCVCGRSLHACCS